jgi:hypothetical protein
MRALAALLLACGCYSPSATSAGYTCTTDNACPTGLSCECGVCVTNKGAAACSFDVDIDSATPSCPDGVANHCVHEWESFKVHLTAKTSDGANSSYTGTATLGSTWGGVHVLGNGGTFAFSAGQATVDISLDRATSANSSLVLTAQAGTGHGTSRKNIVVDPPRFAAENAAVLTPAMVSWSRMYIGAPAVEHGDSGYLLYFNGVVPVGLSAQAQVGLATSPDGKAWTVAPAPVLVPPQGQHYFAPSLLRVAKDDLRLFVSKSSDGIMGSSLVFAKASDMGGGRAFDTPTEIKVPCSYCKDGVVYPWFLADPQSGDWLMYFTSAPTMGSTVTSALQLGRTADQGATWSISPIPTPGTGAAGFSYEGAITPHVVYDARAHLYRMWFGLINDLNACKTTIAYGTSVDGVFFAGARRVAGVNPITPADVPWASGAAGLVPGSIEPPAKDGDPYTIWFSPWSNVLTTCLPNAIGRVTRP